MWYLFRKRNHKKFRGVQNLKISSFVPKAGSFPAFLLMFAVMQKDAGNVGTDEPSVTFLFLGFVPAESQSWCGLWGIGTLELLFS
jgi:hypothetical protein